MRSARPSTACQCKASLFTGFTLMRCAVVLQRIAGHDFVGALAHIAERRGIRHAVVDVKRQQAADLRCLADGAPARRQRLLCARSSSNCFMVVGHRVDQVVGKLPVAHPGIAKQVEPGLIGLQVA